MTHAATVGFGHIGRALHFTSRQLSPLEHHWLLFSDLAQGRHCKGRFSQAILPVEAMASSKDGPLEQQDWFLAVLDRKFQQQEQAIQRHA
eukprot:Skav227492  [mRNA]  locus=scaffold282:111382:113643:+ [translate_table: standard]